MKHLLITAILLFLIFQAYCQNEQPGQETLGKNVVFGSVGLFTANLNYERNLLTFDHSVLNLRAGWGRWAGWAVGGDIFLGNLAWLYGSQAHHFEADLGAMVLVDNAHRKTWYFKGMDKDYWPVINIGYRYQKPGGRMVYRLGIGTELVLILGIGFQFD